MYKKIDGIERNKEILSDFTKAKVAFIRGIKQLGQKTKQEFLTQMKLEREEFLKEKNKEYEEQRLEYEIERGL